MYVHEKSVNKRSIIKRNVGILESVSIAYIFCHWTQNLIDALDSRKLYLITYCYEQNVTLCVSFYLG